MKRLISKPCMFCGTAIMGKKRADRNAYHYPKRCENCARKALDPDVLATKKRVLNSIRPTVPIGTRTPHRASEGFVYIKIKIAEPNVWEYEHRVVAKAKPGDHVHHINGITTDNRPENLKIISPEDHVVLHLSLKDKWAKNFTCCRACGTTAKKHLAKGLCTTCYQRPEADKS